MMWHYIRWNITQPQKWQNCAVCKDTDGPRDCYTEWSKSEREKQIYINAYVWNLGGKWHRWSYLQTINRDKCREQMYGHQRGKGKWDELGDWDWHIYPTMYKIGN